MWISMDKNYQRRADWLSEIQFSSIALKTGKFDLPYWTTRKTKYRGSQRVLWKWWQQFFRFVSLIASVRFLDQTYVTSSSSNSSSETWRSVTFTHEVMFFSTTIAFSYDRPISCPELPSTRADETCSRLTVIRHGRRSEDCWCGRASATAGAKISETSTLTVLRSVWIFNVDVSKYFNGFWALQTKSEKEYASFLSDQWRIIR